MRIFVAVLVAVLIVGGLATAVGLKMRNGNTQAAATAVRVEPVARGDLIEVVSAPGQILPKASRRSMVHSAGNTLHRRNRRCSAALSEA